jgi:hypothetical protein
MYRFVSAVLVVSALAGCAAHAPQLAAASATPVPAPASVPVPVPAWRKAMAPQDDGRLTSLAADWSRLHARLRAATRSAQGALLDPAAGLANAEMPPGSYRCRTLRLRHAARGAATVQPTPAGFCYVSGEDGSLGFSKQTGSDIAAGYFYPDGKRYVFLGARQRRAGDNSFAYGADPARNLVGVAERFGSFRWRLAVPGPHEGDVDVYELTPVPAEQQPRS